MILDSIKRIAERLGKRGMLIAAAAVLIGIILIFLSALDGYSDNNGKESELGSYKRSLEEELEYMCSRIEGVGKCRVTVSFSEGERREYQGSELKCVIPPKVQGVTVLCDGGDSATVRAAVSDMMSSLFDIGKNRICVLKLS